MLVKLKPTNRWPRTDPVSAGAQRGRRSQRSPPVGSRPITSLAGSHEAATLAYVGKRLVQFVLVVFIGINIAFFITHLTPIDPVEQIVAAATAFGSTSPEAIDMLRESLRELYGLEGGLVEQYFTFWGRILRGRLRPVAVGLPDPGLVADLARLPWTVGLLLVATLIAWVLGNLLGGLAGYFRNSRC